MKKEVKVKGGGRQTSRKTGEKRGAAETDMMFAATREGPAAFVYTYSRFVILIRAVRSDTQTPQTTYGLCDDL